MSVRLWDRVRAAGWGRQAWLAKVEAYLRRCGLLPEQDNAVEAAAAGCWANAYGGAGGYLQLRADVRIFGSG